MNESNKPRLFNKGERADLAPEDTTPTLSYFFKQLWRKKGKLLTLNLMMVCQFLPLVAVVLIYLFGRQTTTVANTVFAPLMGIAMTGNSSIAGTLLGVFGEQQGAAFPTTGAMAVMIILIAFTVLTWGWQMVGGAYNLRSLVRGDSCFLWSDYFYAIKRNFKQAFFFGLLDVLVIVVLFFDWYYFSALAGASLGYGVMYFMTIALVIIYIFMRFYIYQMMITFNLSIKKLLKNALIFSMLGIKRNILALLGIVSVMGLNFALIFPSLSIGFTLTLILPFFYLPALAGFMATYAAYPNIQRYMIDGYDQEDAVTEEENTQSKEETDITPPPQEADSQ